MADVPAWLAAVGVVAPSLTAMGGYWLAGQNEEKRDKRAAAREKKARADLRVERLDDERDAFQRDVLLELQDVLLAGVRATVEILFHDIKTLREHGRLTQLGEPLNQKAYDASVRFTRIRARVLDDGLRKELDSFSAYLADLALLAGRHKDTDPQVAIPIFQRALIDLSQRYIGVSEHLSAVLRAILGRSEG